MVDGNGATAGFKGRLSVFLQLPAVRFWLGINLLLPLIVTLLLKLEFIPGDPSNVWNPNNLVVFAAVLGILGANLCALFKFDQHRIMFGVIASLNLLASFFIGGLSFLTSLHNVPILTKQRIEKLQVVHSVEMSMSRAGIEPTDENLKYWRSFAPTTHNLVWTHKSGRRSLVIGCHASHIVGMDKTESTALLSELLEWATRPEFVYRHEWSPGDLIIWDNTGVIHRVEPYPLDCGRVMNRSTLLGEEPFA